VSKIASLAPTFPRVSEEALVIFNGLILLGVSAVAIVAALTVLRSIGLEMAPDTEFALPTLSLWA
jgi:hypothetical protein